MKTRLLLLLGIIAYSFLGCQKEEESEINHTLSDLTNTEWKMEKVTLKANVDVILYPENLDLFGISFLADGEMAIMGGCNYHFGRYSTESKNKIQFSDLGPGTYKFCKDLHDWEMQFIHGLENVLIYRSDGNRLLIISEKNEFNFQRMP